MCAILSIADRKESRKLYQNHAILWDCQGQPVLIYGTRPYLITFLIDQLRCSFQDALRLYKELAVR